jgi:hypothetical protein
MPNYIFLVLVRTSLEPDFWGNRRRHFAFPSKMLKILWIYHSGRRIKGIQLEYVGLAISGLADYSMNIFSVLKKE